MKTKICFKCGVEKSLSDFYKHPQMKDGHLNKCKTCTKRDNNWNRLKNREHYRQYDKQRQQKEERKQKKLEYQRTYRTKNRKKGRVQGKTLRAIKKGVLIRPTKCERCFTENAIIEAHHEDYDKPLDVQWLCPECHRLTHLSKK